MLFTVKDALIVADILRDAAKAEIMPRWRSLSSEAIRQKTSPLDLVTDADEAAERVIGAALAKAFPGATVIGEESTEKDASLLDGIAGADLAFIIDPVDGTANFAAGLPLFGVMAAVTVRGKPSRASSTIPSAKTGPSPCGAKARGRRASMARAATCGCVQPRPSRRCSARCRGT